MIAKSQGAFKQLRSFQRGRVLILSQLVRMGKHTITGLICAAARQFQDWSADYRLFSRERFDREGLFKAIRRETVAELGPEGPIVVGMDDTIIRKSSRKTPGVAYRRDPLGPKFRVNLVRAQRFLQLSMALPPRSGPGPARMVPVDFIHAPTPKKPGKKAPPEQWAEYKKLQRETSVCRLGAERVRNLRHDLDQNPAAAGRPLWMVVDGGFTNGEVLKRLPKNTVVIGRVRKDAKLFYPPAAADQPAGAGRKRRYGDRAPTPEQLRQDEATPWRRISAFAAGKTHEFKIKTLEGVLWEKTGAAVPLLLLVIAPLAYRPRQNSRLLYRQPAYLVCTDPKASLAQVLQAYLWRWEIEVNHRDEKQLIGVGEAQVHHPASVANAPALAVAAYAMILLAGHRAHPGEKIAKGLLAPKWRQGQAKPRLSLNDLLSELRAELLRDSIGDIRFNLGGFRAGDGDVVKRVKSDPDPVSAMLYPAA